MADLDKLIAKATQMLESNKSKTESKDKPELTVELPNENLEEKFQNQAKKHTLTLSKQNNRIITECERLESFIVHLSPLQKSTSFLAHQFSVENSELQSNSAQMRANSAKSLRETQFIVSRTDDLNHWHSWFMFFCFLFLAFFAFCSLYTAFSIQSIILIVALGILPYVSPLFALISYFFN